MSTPLITNMAAGLLSLCLALPIVYLAMTRTTSTTHLALAPLLSRLSKFIDSINAVVGTVASWLTLLMVLVQTIVVVQRYVFGVNYIWMQESITYMHGILFMLAAGYTLLHNGHVRVDIFYREASAKRKALTDLVGTYLFLIPVLWVIWVAAFPYVELSWTMREGSTETSGIQAVYLLKAVILAFVVLLMLQAYSLAIRSALTLADSNGDGTSSAEAAAKL